MAAGIIQGTVTTTTGETIEMSWLVDDTVTPTKWYNLTHLVNSAGAGAAYGSGAAGATVLRVLHATDDPVVTALTAGATTIAKAEDVASGGGDVGVPAMAVQQSTPADTGANADYGFLQMSGGHLWVAPPVTTKASANFNRPADTTGYTANDAVSDNTTAGSVTKLSFSIGRSAGVITRVKVRKSDQTVATPTIRVWFWDATFAVGAGDNAAFAAPLQDGIGFVDLAVTSAGSDDAVGWASCEIPFSAATVYCLLQTLSAFTPANAETFTVEIHYTPG